MATPSNFESGTLRGTVSGTALAVMVNIGSPDILRTVVLAVVGAVVSFSVSLVLKWLVRWIRK